MMFRNLSKAFAVLFISVLVFSLPAEAAPSYSKAKKAGAAHAPSCGKGAFFDIKGQCWKCPKGYKHDNILLKPTHNKVCKKKGSTTKIKAKKVGKSVVGICKKGSWVSTNNWNCYKCKKGYKHNPFKYGNKKGACYKKHADKFSKAKKKGGSLVCKKGFFDPIDKGSCWTCPSNFPNRTLKSVKSAQACVTATCGSLNARPCLITERFPSCDKGLAEDFFVNKCIDTALAACLTGVRTLRYSLKAAKGLSQVEKEVMKVAQKGLEELKKSVPGLKKVMDAAEKETRKLTNKAKELVSKNLDKLLPEALAAMEKIGSALEKIDKTLRRNKEKFTTLVTSDSFCTMNGKERKREITKLLGSGLSEIKSAQADTGIWTKFAESMFIKKTHAAKSFNFEPAGLMVGLSLQVQRHGFALGPVLAYGWDFSGKSSGLYLGSEATLTTDPTNRLRVGPYVKLIPKKPRIWDETSFISIKGVLNRLWEKNKNKDTSDYKRRGDYKFSLGISAVINWNDAHNPVSFGGVTLFPGLAEKKSQDGDSVKGHLDLSVSHLFKVTDFK